MQTKIWISAVTALNFLASPLMAQSCLEQAKAEFPNAPASQALACVEQMQAELEAANVELVAVNRILKHAVLAFNRSEDIGSCPDGWSPFDAAGGRMITGAGEHTNGGVSEYPSFADDENEATGGNETVTLKKEEMPAHQHVSGSLSAAGNANFLHSNPGLGVLLGPNGNLGTALNGLPPYDPNLGTHEH